MSALTRREFLLAGLGALVLPSFAQAGTPGLRLLSPATRDGKHFSAALAAAGGDPTSATLAALPWRGHGLQLDPRHPGEALIVSRRPGTMAVKLDLASGRVLHQWQANEDRHFFGHAIYSADGRHVFVNENNIDTGRGLVSVRDADTFKTLEEYSSHGIGPHELLLMPDGVTLVVANGGIQTFPETGRVKINRGRIETGLAYIDSRDGKLRGKYVLPTTRMSLRHLAIGAGGKVGAALQSEGSRDETNVPLLVFHGGEDALQVADAPAAEWNRMQRYAASIGYDPVSRRFAISCPNGDSLACWNADGSYAGIIAVPKVSGIAFGAGEGFVSNELGQIHQVDLSAMTARLHHSVAGLQWDNHLYIQAA